MTRAHPSSAPAEGTVDGALLETLHDFRAKVNGHDRVRALIRGWEPVIVIESTGGVDRYYLPVTAGEIVEVTTVDPCAEHTVLLRATEVELVRIFKGESNPAESFLNGDLELFAADKDQVKLDAISLVLWGM